MLPSSRTPYALHHPHTSTAHTHTVPTTIHISTPSQVFHRTPAYEDGSLCPGDELVSVNGVGLKGLSRKQTADIIQAEKVSIFVYSPASSHSSYIYILYFTFFPDFQTRYLTMTYCMKFKIPLVLYHSAITFWALSMYCEVWCVHFLSL